MIDGMPSTTVIIRCTALPPVRIDKTSAFDAPAGIMNSPALIVRVPAINRARLMNALADFKMPPFSS
jgi:hypothetical protein